MFKPDDLAAGWRETVLEMREIAKQTSNIQL